MRGNAPACQAARGRKRRRACPLARCIPLEKPRESFLLRRKQRSVAARRRDVDRHRLLGREPPEIVGSARLRAGAGEAAAAERLGADHGADHVAVDVDIPVSEPPDDALDRRVDARMNAEGEAVAARCDVFEQGVELLGAPAHDVQDRTENLLAQVARAIEGDDRRRHERSRRRQRVEAVPAKAHAASALITGPTWVEISRGSPSLSSRAAPAIISTMGSATSSCTHKRRSAEQRWPAERKADATTSSATCSGRAVASTMIGLTPPVSAISGTIAESFTASARLIERATSVEPVKATPATLASATSAAPTLPSPGTRCSAVGGMPASCNRRVASAAIRGVCSAGFATTVLPARSAAIAWPRKIESGKFHGLMQTKAPRPR